MIHHIAWSFFKWDYRRFLLKTLPKNSVGCELGVWKADLSKEILRVVKPRRLFLVDPWLFQARYPHSWYGGAEAKNQADMDRIFTSVRDQCNAWPNVTVIRKKTVDLKDEIPNAGLDWAYIDGNHDYECVLLDLRTFCRKIKAGGILCGDDYDRGSDNNYPVTRAVAEFLKEDTCRLLWVRRHQFYLQKHNS